MFVLAWTDQSLNFGNHTSNRAESQYAKLKLYLKYNKYNLDQFVNYINQIVQSQVTEINASFERSTTYHYHQHNLPILTLLRSHVSKEALDLILNELLRLDDPEFDYSMCGYRLRNSFGLPCACVLLTYSNSGECIPLDSVDIFWRTLKVSWSEPLEDDDIQCEDVLHHFKEKFNLNMQPTRQSSVSNTQTGWTHNLIPDINEEPPRHSSFVSQTSMWHDSSTDEQIEIERLRKQIPKVVHPYILVSGIQNVRSDGNCGFRAVALGLGLSEDQWPRIRSDLVRELEARQQQYKYVFGTIGYEKIYNTVKFVGRWMEMPDTGLVIASAYKKVVVNLSDVGGCNTSFPLWSRPSQSNSHETIVVAHVDGNHYIRVVLREDYRLAKVADLMMKHVIVPAVRFGSHSFAVEEQRLDSGYMANVALRITPPSGAQHGGRALVAGEMGLGKTLQ
nr:hypothetical protein [Tanacetum cinerariifolium]